MNEVHETVPKGGKGRKVTMTGELASAALATKRQNPRATLLALRAEHLAAFALVGDTEAARIVSDAIAELLGARAAAAPVVDLSSARRR